MAVVEAIYKYGRPAKQMSDVDLAQYLRDHVREQVETWDGMRLVKVVSEGWTADEPPLWRVVVQKEPVA